MSKILKIALENKKPLRKCVRIIIRKNNKIVLGKRIKNDTGELICYDFIGGGVDDASSMEEAVRKECLEEVGMAVTNIQKLSVVDSQYFVLPNPERAKIYGGGEDHYFVADFQNNNKSIYNSEGDAMLFEWVTIDQAINKIKNGPESDYNPARLKALNEVKHM